MRFELARHPVFVGGMSGIFSGIYKVDLQSSSLTKIKSQVVGLSSVHLFSFGVFSIFV